MLFLRETLILVLITTMSSPVIIEMAPTILESLILIPKIAIGSFIISQGTGLIGAQLMWKVLQYKKIKERNLERFRGPKIISGPYYGWDNIFEGSSNMPRTRYPSPPHLRVKPLSITDRVKKIINSIQKEMPEDLSKLPLGTIEIPVPDGTEIPEDLKISNDKNIASERRLFNEFPSETTLVSQSVPLESDDYMKLMSWTQGKPLEFKVGSKNPFSNRRFGILGKHQPGKKNPIHHVIDVTKLQRKSDDMRMSYRTTSLFNEDSSFLSPIVKDIGNFFSLVSKFDANNCLEKLICEIHMKAKSSRISRDKLSTYERHVIDAFSVLDNLLVDSSVINNDSKNKCLKSFLKAAHLGRASTSNMTCKKTYRNCKYNSNFIIGLSNKFMFTKSKSTTNPLASSNPSQHVIRKRVLQ